MRRLSTAAAYAPHSDPVRTWDGALKLELQRVKQATRLLRNERLGPLYVQKPFYPEGEDCAHIYVLHPPAGLVTGDRLRMQVLAGADSSALLTTPGAGRFYRARSTKRGGDSTAIHKQDTQQTLNHFDLKKGANIEWLPFETIVYDGANAHLETRIDCEAGACFIGWELVCLGLPAAQQQFNSGRFMQSLSVYIDAVPQFIDRLVFEANDRVRRSKIGLNNEDVFGTMVIGPLQDCDERRLDELVEELRHVATEVTSQADDFYGAVSITRVRQLLLVRYLGASTLHGRRVFLALWRWLRPEILNRAVSEPGIWRT